MTDERDDTCGCGEYHALSRRQFIQATAGITGALAMGAAFPAWLPRIVLAKHYSSNRDVIVSVFQRGGVDGGRADHGIAGHAVAQGDQGDTRTDPAERGIALQGAAGQVGGVDGA